MTRVAIEKTYKLFIKGEFVRSESGRSLPVKSGAGGQGESVTNIARGSRKDAREAVLAAKVGYHAWAAKTAYLRGQVLYRLAEVIEGRRAEFIASRTSAGSKDAVAEVDAAIDRVVHYAGWPDKVSALLSTLNPVAGPHYNVTSPEPMGVVAIVAPDQGDVLLALVSAVIPVIVPGNGVLVLAPESDPQTAITFCECLATSDLPAGVVNLLTGLRAELLPGIARHMDIAGVDLWKGGTVTDEMAKDAAIAGADNVKRIKIHAADQDLRSNTLQGLGFIDPWVEQKTIWHPVGL